MKINLGIASLIGALTIVLGAFGAHALEDTLTADGLKSFETAVRYQMYHVFALTFAGWALKQHQSRRFEQAGWFFVAGVALFSGSLYIMTFTGLKWLGAITPLGGLAFLAGWLSLIIGFWKLK